MSAIGGPPGVGGPKGPRGPERASELSPTDPIDEASDEVAGDPPVDRAGATGAAALEALAAELAAGQATRRDLVDRLVEATAGGGLGVAGPRDLDEIERAELRELLDDLVSNDPHLGSLIDRF